MVYVISSDGLPLMPTKRYRKVRLMLQEGKAVVVKRSPFTIRLKYETESKTQPITLGIDAGSKTIGVSASTEDEELYSSEVMLRNDIVKLIASRREVRRTRRSRLRYRKARFDNRTRGDKWLAPSVRQKIDTHLKVVADVNRILPITDTVVETASFDIQKIKYEGISGKEYQEGDQLGFWNVREYVLFRDGHECQCCHGKSKDLILNVHHIESRQTGGDAPNNLITLCETCHKKYHKGLIELPKTIHRGMKFKDAAFMGIMRWALCEELKQTYPNVKMTFGYITKNTRITHGLPKEHCIDALCIAGHPDAKPAAETFYMKKIRCHNRQMCKSNILKGGVMRRNQAAREIKGFRRYDTVRHDGKEYYINSRRTAGAFVMNTLQGDRLEIMPSKIEFIEHVNSFITERRMRGCFANATQL